jgi:TFIIH basal transcription factor complex TTD-A subunit
MPPRKVNKSASGAGKRKANARGAGSRSKSPTPATKKNSASSRSSKSSKSSKSSTAGALPSAGFLITCDPPTKQYIKRLDDLKSNEKKFVLEDLDETHLLVKDKARAEIMRKVEDWMNEVSTSNLYRCIYTYKYI